MSRPQRNPALTIESKHPADGNTATIGDWTYTYEGCGDYHRITVTPASPMGLVEQGVDVYDRDYTYERDGMSATSPTGAGCRGLATETPTRTGTPTLHGRDASISVRSVGGNNECVRGRCQGRIGGRP